MAEKKSVESLVYEVCRENRESLLAYGPDFARIEREALAKLRKRQGARRRRVWVRAAAAVAAAVILINGLIFFVDFAPVKAYRAELRKLYFNLINEDSGGSSDMQIVKTSNDLRNTQKAVPFQIPFPHWLPEGYTLENIRSKNDGYDLYSVTIKYYDSSMEPLKLLIITIENKPANNNTLPSENEGAYEKKTIAGHDTWFLAVENEEFTRLKCMYFTDDGLLITVSGVMSEQDFTHLVAEIRS